MKNWKVDKLILVLLFGVFILLAACSNGNNETNNDPVNNEPGNNEPANNEENEGNGDEELEPVTLLMATHWDDEQFEGHFKSHVEDKFPHITLEHVQSHWRDLEENVFAKNIEPDLMMTTLNEHLIEIDFAKDLNPLIDLFDFDVNRLEPGIMSYFEELSNDGELNGFPFIRPEYALVYNPDIFDTFGVDYPKDNMTWEEVIALAYEVSGERNGVNYRGLHSGGYQHMMNQLEGHLSVDPETHEPIIEQNEAYKNHLERLEEILAIPGNGFDDPEEWKDTRGVDLLRDGELAMAPDRAYAGAYAGRAAETGLNFDFVTYPVWGGEYGTYGPNEVGNGLIVTTLTEHPEEAFRVIEYLLSDEYQSWQAGTGNLPAVVSEEVRANFMKGNEHYDEMLADKNLEAITGTVAAPIPLRSPYQGDILEGTDFREGLINGVDINTILREMQDQAEGNAKGIIGRQ